MMQVIPKWKVTVEFAAREHVVFWMHDSLANVLRALPSLQFTESGLDQPDSVSVSRAETGGNQIGSMEAKRA